MGDIELKKRENESAFEYYKRIVYGKLVDKTLSDLDFSEIAELLWGKAYASDVARRMLYGSRMTLDAISDDIAPEITESDVLDQIREQKEELQKERKRFQDQRREYNKILATDSRSENLYDELKEAAVKLKDTVGVVFENKEYNDVEYSDNEAVLVFSDWHYGMTADNVFNTYDTSICIDRVKKVVAGAKRRLRTHRCRVLHIVILGDLFHGAIHTSARVAAEELVCDQIMQVSEILAQAIYELSKDVETVFVYSTYGNHARTVQNKKDSIHRDNMERLIPWWLNERFSNNENVIITDEQDTEFLFINSCGHDICASHGDLDSVRTSPRLLSTLFHKRYGKDIECILLGDKHHRESFNELGVTAMICGSLCGTDDYANDRRLFSTPSQLLLIVNRDEGVDAEYNIKC